MATFRPLAALSRVYAGPSGESNEKLWIQEVAWHEEQANWLDSKAEISVSDCNSVCYRQHTAEGLVKLFWPRNSVNSHVRPQNSRDYDGAIRLLIILHDRNPGASNSQPRAVQRMHELALSAPLGLEPDTRAPCLKRFAVRAR